MQGWKTFIPTEKKIEYINKLLQVGFDTIDFGSFVSPKAIPQLADTTLVIPKLQMTASKLLAIIANSRGADDAVQYDEISYIGFPFSISETFQLKNTNSTIAESLKTVEAIQEKCVAKNKKLVIYISMGFGNPYGDEYNSDIAIQWVEKLSSLGINIFSMSDTVGISNPSTIDYIFTHLVTAFPAIEFGAHFHSTRETANEKIASAFDANCFRFDSALKGIGGCPMAQNELVGNLATEQLVDFFKSKKIDLGLNKLALQESMDIATSLFI
jgi:hydroxymethylglutaryl-CoA lyase